MRPVAVLIVAAFIAASCSTIRDEPAQEPTEPPSRPNVLIIVTDDQRASGTMNQAMPKTVRHFGDGGTRFTQAFATTPLCCPSRASIFSGRYAHRHGVLTNQFTRELDTDTTMQAALQADGYRTAITGKYLNRWPKDLDPPHFDDWAIMLQGYYYDAEFNVGGTRRMIDGYTNHFIEDQALEFLDGFEQRDQQPWMLYIGATPPHSPYEAEPKYRGVSVPRYVPSPAVKETNLSDKPDLGPSKRTDFRKIRRKQLRTLLSVDDMVDQLMKKLAALDEDRDTIAFFLGDNGQMWGEHGYTAKRYPYTASIKIPFYVRWPGQVEAGARDRRLVANIDIAPTVLDLAGLLEPEAVDGRSLFSEEPRERLLLEHWADNEAPVPEWVSLLTPEHQYTEYYRAGGGLLAREYYDRASDPWQLRNLLGDRRKANDPDVRALATELDELHGCEDSSCP